MRLPMRLKTLLLAAAVIAVSFLVSLKAMDWLSPRGNGPAPVLAELPPLPPASRSSIIVAPVAVSLAAIRDVADRAAPRTFAGKADNPASQILQNADIGWTASRGPIAAAGAQDVLSLTTALTGTLNATGSLSSKTTGAVANALGSLLGSNAAKQIGSVNIKNINANADIKGSITITSRPKLAAAWHLEPNLAGQVTLGDSNLSVAGARVNVPAQVKPLIDKAVADQLGALGSGSATIAPSSRCACNGREPAVRFSCRAPRASTIPPLWLELRPTRAIAVQPHVDASA